MSLRRSLTITFSLLAMTGCTGQLPGSFRYQQQVENFRSQSAINTKIDLLWVVDNSSSMDVSQDKLRKGFAGFAAKYMQPTWDIRVAVITTDTYLANNGFSAYLNSTIPGTTGWGSPYINTRLSTFVNPTWNPNLVNLSTGKFPNGVKYKELTGVWDPSYARLLPGLHDGPIPGLCWEGNGYFLKGETNCKIRDDQTNAAYQDASHCLNPSGGESSITQCVNTVQNNSVRSGVAIISTQTTANLAQVFTINVTTGTAGHGSERGLGSVLQVIADNESTPTAFFRAGSLRGLIFVSDEDDQTMDVPATTPAGFSPFSYYKCDQASLIALNGSGPITGVNGYCCNTAGNNCTFGSEGTSCASKTVDGFTYTTSTCPRTDKLVPVSSVKSQLDAFFLALDGASATTANYFVASIVPLTAQTIQDLQAARNADDTAVGALKTFAVDRGDRYIELGNLVGNGSMAMNIGESDYSLILDAIGKLIIEKKSTFALARAPTGQELTTVTVRHADGTVTAVRNDQYTISGKTLTITDLNFVLSLSATDTINVDYQPKSAN